MIQVLYVDDSFLIWEEILIAKCQREITSDFVMKYLGLLHYCLDLDIWHRNDEIFLSQGKCTVDILHIFGMVDWKSMSSPMVSNMRKLHQSNIGSDKMDPTLYTQLIGSMMYLIHSRSDICYVVSILSRFMSDPRHRNWVAAKNVLRYLRGMISYGLGYAFFSSRITWGILFWIYIIVLEDSTYKEVGIY